MLTKRLAIRTFVIITYKLKPFHQQVEISNYTAISKSCHLAHIIASFTNQLMIDCHTGNEMFRQKENDNNIYQVRIDLGPKIFFLSYCNIQNTAYK